MLSSSLTSEMYLYCFVFLLLASLKHHHSSLPPPSVGHLLCARPCVLGEGFLPSFIMDRKQLPK